MIFKWFDTGEVDTFADGMAREFTDHISIADIEKGGKKAELRLGEAHESLLRQASEFAGTHQLNIYKKSRLANRVKWALLDAGYPKPLVDDLAYKLATAVTLAGKK